jgi:hypothetical protein
MAGAEATSSASHSQRGQLADKTRPRGNEYQQAAKPPSARTIHDAYDAWTTIIIPAFRPTQTLHHFPALKSVVLVSSFISKKDIEKHQPTQASICAPKGRHLRGRCGMVILHSRTAAVSYAPCKHRN